MLNSLTYSLPEDLLTALQAEFDVWQNENKIARIWEKDASVWTNEDEAKWLGWLDSVEAEIGRLDDYRDFADDAKNFSDIALLGMGGSSLCPEVLSISFGKKNFHILDSTVPAQIKTLESKLELTKTLFIVASKSGSTLEPNCFKQYFFERVSEIVGRENAEKQFVAITDPDSKMQKVAEADNFRKIFFGNPEIGGRFSALSPFGMAASAAMGIDVEDFLRRAQEMVEACKNENPRENPGAILGTILGVCHRYGRDKLTIFTTPEIYDLGAWLEQLLAESTGKEGVSIIPVDREPGVQSYAWHKPRDKGTIAGLVPGATLNDYSYDRVFAALKLKADDSLDAKISALEANGHPIVKIELANIENLGQEFFRWEFATAVAGAIMKINPFNQPDVEAAKIEARKLTDEYEEKGELPAENPFYEENGIKLFSDGNNIAELSSLIREKTLAGYLKAHLSRIVENDYFALLAYIEMNAENEDLLQEIRGKVLANHKVATCLGFGPRFLHSTGQAYKGGANNGVFLQITSDDAEDLGVPGQKYTFGVVKAAQARGDFQVLLDRKRRALRVHLSKDVKNDLEKLSELL